MEGLLVGVLGGRMGARGSMEVRGAEGDKRRAWEGD